MRHLLPWDDWRMLLRVDGNRQRGEMTASPGIFMNICVHVRYTFVESLEGRLVRGKATEK